MTACISHRSNKIRDVDFLRHVVSERYSCPDLAQILQRASDAAEAGMKSTVPMLATKGRASYLGERSVGHQDPGATSSWLVLKTLASQ